MNMCFRYKYDIQLQKRQKIFLAFCIHVKSNYLNLHKCKKYEIINLK